MANKLITKEASELAREIVTIGLAEGASEFQVKIRDTHANYIRFANSEIHQFSQDNIRELKLVALINKRKGLSLVVPTTDGGLKKSIRNLVSATKVNSDDPDQLSFYPTGKAYRELELVDESFKSWDQEFMAETVKKVIHSAHEVDSSVKNVSGMLQTMNHKFVLMNSQELFLSTNQTEFWYGVDILAKKGKNTGRNSQGETNRFAHNIPFFDLAETAAKFAVLGINPVKLESGDYTAILDYYAVLEPLVFINLGLSGLFVKQHRSFLARKIGQKVFSNKFNLKHSPFLTPLVTSKSFDDEGVPTKEFYFIKEGVVESLAHNRLTAFQMEKEPNGCGYESERTSFGIPTATLLEPSRDHTFEDLVQEIENGILISRLYYSNWANPMAGILTGTTRNGFFKIESGEITTALHPMRHTTSIFEMFGEGLELANKIHQPPMQMMPGVQSIMVPALKTSKMHMTTYAN
ncbi:hypothetical protein CEE45_08175 [Candidatus Heimdallarchaeota archaeon B3_Heim]|nr:MAG: hypothetical protein CEE45_08175 [Candidatus Heimdallarchaeota archaeon B3_Heim]